MPVTGADIPAELFPHIICHLQIPGPWQASHKSELADVLPCTLVCVYWANQCRRLIWPDIYLVIRSQARAEEFRRFCLSPRTTRLEPIAKLIRFMDVTQQFRADTRPWLHFFFLSATQVPVDELIIEGPVPASVPVASLRTPYWGIPRSLPPTIAQCVYFKLWDMSFGSLDDVISFASHFTGSKSMFFDRVTWPSLSTGDLHARTPLFPLVAEYYPKILAWHCTDPAGLFLRCAGIGVTSGPLHALTSTDQVAFGELVRAAYTYLVQPAVEHNRSFFTMHPNGSCLGSRIVRLDPGGSKVGSSLNFLCRPQPHQVGAAFQSQAIESLAFMAYTAHHAEEVTLDLAKYLSSDAWSHVPRLPFLRTILICLPTFADVLATRELHTTLRQYVPGHLTYFCVACQRSTEHPFEETEGGTIVVIDPDTMLPTGETWDDPHYMWQNVLHERHGVIVSRTALGYYED